MVATRERVYRKGTEAGKGSTREERGVALAEERFEEIVKVRPWTWSVPSASGNEAYEVNLKHRTCSCPDRTPEGETDKHVVSVLWVKANTSECAGCGERSLHPDLVEVGPEMAAFAHDVREGEHYCRPCARRAGVG